MKMKFIILFVISLTTLWACKKDNDEPTNGVLGGNRDFTPETYKDFLFGQLGNLNSLLVIESTNNLTNNYSDTTTNGWNQFFNSISASTGKDLSGFPTTTVNGVKVPVARVDLSEDVDEIILTDGEEDAYFGTYVSITAFGACGKMYIPQKIFIYEPVPDNKNPAYTPALVARDTPIVIRWNQDSKSRGVVIEFEYFDFLTGQTLTYSEGTEDDGEYTLPSSWLSTVPIYENFTIKIVRGNYHVANQEDYIGGFASAIIYLRLSN
jgi:hypothetical protein